MSLSIPFPVWVAAEQKVARVEVVIIPFTRYSQLSNRL